MDGAPAARPPRRLGLLVLAAVLAHHWGLWLLLAHRRELPLLTVLNRWDAEHYTTIAVQGQHDALWAFFPLYPAVVRAAGAALGGALAPAFVGCAVSTAALLAFVLGATGPAAAGDREALRPSAWGLFFVLYGPTSYTLHSHHTEATFLLLSFAALTLAARARALPAALFAGLTLWCRVQGVFVAATVLLLLAAPGAGEEVPLGPARAEPVPRSAFALSSPRRAVLAAAATIGALGCAFLAWEWALAGSPLAFLQAQGHWTHATSAADMVRALWLGNPWQNTGAGSVLRQLWFCGALALAIGLARRDRALGAYALLSLAPMFLQAEGVNVFRYLGVAFPLWFWAGHRFERAPRWLQVAVALGLVALNHWTALSYAQGHWAY